MNAPINSTATPTPAISLSPSVAADPAVILAMQIRAKRDLYIALETKSADAQKRAASSADIFYDGAAMEAFDAQEALRDCLTNVETNTMEGAAIHIAEAISRFASIWSEVDETKLHDRAGFDARAIDRLLYSALSVVMEAAAHSLDDIAGENFDNQQCNPWTKVGRALSQEAAR